MTRLDPVRAKMKRWSALWISAIGACAAAAPIAGQDPRPAALPSERMLTTRDDVTIPALMYRSESTVGRPFVLLFHQDGASGAAEYASIAPRVHAMGANVLVIDQRRGGDLFGGANRVAGRFDPDTTSYCDVMPDLEAALEYARETEPARRVVLWGSSYSAALAIQLAAMRSDEVAAVLAFSPASGDPMEGCRPEGFAARLELPLLALRPGAEMEYAWIAEQLDMFKAMGHETWVADPGRHGSSMLVTDRVGSDTGESWAVVEAFLRRALGGG